MNFKIEMINDMTFSISERQTILEASLEAGIPHYHVCGGKAKCSTCRVLLHEGEENLSEQNKEELKLRKEKNFPSNVRLACQTKVLNGNVKLQRIIKDEMDLSLYVYGSACDGTEGIVCQGKQSIGEERELALFFLDIRNFTPFIEKYLPFDVIHIVRRLMMLFTGIINSNNGRVIEFAGDGFYAAFGFEESINEAVKNAVEAGKKIFLELNILNENYLNKFFNLEIEVGIGLHAGKVIVGEKAIGEKGSLTAMGFPVNIASRLEVATKELNNSFIVSDYAYSLLGSEDETVMKQIILKGVSKPFNVRLMGAPFTYLKKN